MHIHISIILICVYCIDRLITLAFLCCLRRRSCLICSAPATVFIGTQTGRILLTLFSLVAVEMISNSSFLRRQRRHLGKFLTLITTFPIMRPGAIRCIVILCAVFAGKRNSFLQTLAFQIRVRAVTANLRHAITKYDSTVTSPLYYRFKRFSQVWKRNSVAFDTVDLRQLLELLFIAFLKLTISGSIFLETRSFVGWHEWCRFLCSGHCRSG